MSFKPLIQLRISLPKGNRPEASRSENKQQKFEQLRCNQSQLCHKVQLSCQNSSFSSNRFDTCMGAAPSYLLTRGRWPVKIYRQHTVFQSGPAKPLLSKSRPARAKFGHFCPSHCNGSVQELSAILRIKPLPQFAVSCSKCPW